MTLALRKLSEARAPRSPIRPAQMRVTCLPLNRKWSASQTLILSRRRNSGESRRLWLASSAFSIRFWLETFGKSCEEACEICRLHESVDRLLCSHVAGQERNNFQVFRAGVFWNADQED